MAENAARRGLSANVLKIIAAAAMAADHAGILLFPGVRWLRIVGRLAMPVFAWFIAEGMTHTRSPLRYFLRVFILAVVCQIPYFIFEKDLYLSILFTFTFSILIMWIVRAWREREPGLAPRRRALFAAALVGATAAVAVLTVFVDVDYGFFGVILPVSAFVFRDRRAKLAAFSAVLAAMSAVFFFSQATGNFLYDIVRHPQPFSLLALPLIALYSGERGRVRMKYFFYIIYPAHMGILWLLSQIVRG